MEFIWPVELEEGDDGRGFEDSGEAEEIPTERRRETMKKESLTVESMSPENAADSGEENGKKVSSRGRR